MRIRLLSDLHLETGPFTWEDQGEDVVVLAGDIGEGITGIQWAKTIPKPVIYVAGNHEHYGQDIYDNIKAMRACAKGSNVHFLENGEVHLTVNGETVRFLGCAFWTDYGSKHCEHKSVAFGDYANPVHALMEHAAGIMNDFAHISAKKWWNKRNEKRFTKIFYLNHLTQFNPIVAFDMNAKSRVWLTEKLAEKCDHKTVVVTHHAPSYQSLIEAKMIDKRLLEHPEFWRPSRRTEGGLHRIAAYASDAEDLFPGVDLWLHGHTHSRIRYSKKGTLVSCNPRGYHIKPLTKKEIDAFRIMGYPVSEGALERSLEAFAENPERGDTRDFERNLVIELDTKQ